MNVLFAASECVPFAKTGGLADVLGALPRRLGALEQCDTQVILPKYSRIPAEFKERMHHVRHIYVPVGWRWQYCGLDMLRMDEQVYYFVDNEYYFGRDAVYGYDDDPERFAFFCRAVLELIPYLEAQPEILHTHDWQTGMINALLELQYRHRPSYRDLGTVFTIHNLHYQGICGREALGELFSLGDEHFRYDRLEFFQQVSLLKGGLQYAERLTTVSPTYAKEIQDPYFGERMDPLLRHRASDLQGILNGIDVDAYNPQTDPHVPFHYGADECAEGKWRNKQTLGDELGLAVQADVPLVAMVTRLVALKGLDLLAHVMDEILAQEIQCVFLGTGEWKYEQLLRDLCRRHPDRIAAQIRFDEGLARRLYAGSDIFLMPSRAEPCGLAQLIALRYGSIPLVRATGGLKDTVTGYNEQTGDGNGFVFSAYNAHEMLFELKRALGVFADPPAWRRLVKQAMSADYSWDRSAERYLTLYQGLRS